MIQEVGSSTLDWMPKIRTMQVGLIRESKFASERNKLFPDGSLLSTMHVRATECVLPRLIIRHASGSCRRPFPFPSGTNPTPHEIFHLPRSASQDEIKIRCEYPPRVAAYPHRSTFPLLSSTTSLEMNVTTRLRARQVVPPRYDPQSARHFAFGAQCSIPCHHPSLWHPPPPKRPGFRRRGCWCVGLLWIP